MSIVEELSGNDVDGMLQLRKINTFCFTCFAYVLDMGFPLEFVVDNET